MASPPSWTYSLPTSPGFTANAKRHRRREPSHVPFHAPPSALPPAPPELTHTTSTCHWRARLRSLTRVGRECLHRVPGALPPDETSKSLILVRPIGLESSWATPARSCSAPTCRPCPLKEAREILQKWGEEIERIVSGAVRAQGLAL